MRPVPLVAAVCVCVCVCVCSGCPNPLALQMRQRKDTVAWKRQCHLNQTVPVAHTQTGGRKEGIICLGCWPDPQISKGDKMQRKGRMSKRRGSGFAKPSLFAPHMCIFIHSVGPTLVTCWTLYSDIPIFIAYGVADFGPLQPQDPAATVGIKRGGGWYGINKNIYLDVIGSFGCFHRGLLKEFMR
ncbi:exo-alpha-sialidase [Trypanosoma cruzi]|nr:exo-alpha-sialidase [Trypanosoma cruzi]